MENKTINLLKMTKTLKYINQLVANADPNNYDSISYGKYYKDLANISTTLLHEQTEQQTKEKSMLIEINKLEDSEAKTRLLNLLK